NAVGPVTLAGVEVLAARTGYTGEPECFELFIPLDGAVPIWNKILAAGAKPVGLGARDTLRLEAGLPLYGHELGTGPDGQIPIYAIGQAPFAVSFEDRDRAFIGRDALQRQAAAKQRYKAGDFSDAAALPKVVRQVRLIDQGIAREGSKVYDDGWVSSGTMVPHWVCEVAGDGVQFKDEQARRAIGLCLIDPRMAIGSEIEIEVRGRMLKAEIVARNLENRKVKRTYAL
ncbi:MAG: aminomethyltransferase family protein, partial [Planctomycetota bacterium]